jgi:selenocysteine lyase/cysteine desulfurase
VTYEEGRALFPVLERLAYLNAGTNGPYARPTVDAVRAELDRQLVEGRSGAGFLERAMELRAAVRERLAALLDVDRSHVALTASTTDGCNIVLAGLDLGPDDEVVTTDSEHFGLIGPLHASGARVVVVPPHPEPILAAVGSRTRLVAVSHVIWTTGAVLPVEELRRRSGVPILVDGAQSVGAVPVRAGNADFYTISGQKWLCGPGETGGLYVADPERLRVARPSYLSQAEHRPDGSFVPSPGAERFEPNWSALPLLAGLAAAIDTAPEWRYDRAAAMAARCREVLARHVEVLPGGATLVAFRPPEGEPAERAVERLAEAGVVIRDLPGRNLLRASCGWWTNDADLGRLAKVLSS